MKQIYIYLFTTVFGLSTMFSFGNITMETDSVSLEAGYAKDVYYSLEDGEVHSVERQNWDIGFHTSPWSAGIIVNGGNGVELYLYPYDTSNWDAIDTTGLSNWPVLFNSTDDWEEGAFSRNSLGHPDYGWGIYNSITHEVVGDSLYILKLADQSYKKIWIERKASMQNKYYFKYADIDGGNEVTKVLNCGDYTDKNFVYYSLQTGEVLDREPDKGTWDILFTKYMGINNGVPYPVTGVLNNIDIAANKFEKVGSDFEDWESSPMDSAKSPIGYDWKYFDMGTFSYVVVDSLAYFVRNKNENVYKLVFTGFAGSTTGKVYFQKSLISTAAINDANDLYSFSIYPNPASDYVTIELPEGDSRKELEITDITGKIVARSYLSGTHGNRIQLDDLRNGLYFVTLKSATHKQVQKLVIRNN